MPLKISKVYNIVMGVSQYESDDSNNTKFTWSISNDIRVMIAIIQSFSGVF